MSREIDERVVQMKFESGQFEKNIQTSIHSLDELKKGLNFKDAVNGFDELDKAAKSVDISAIGKAAEQVQIKFGMFEVFMLNVMNRISNAAINTGEQLIKSLTVDQITPGWGKYEQKTGSVQTIMAATAAQFSNTADQMKVVNEQLDKLNWFTDETSYNFVDMVSNIGKFTSNNIALDKSVTAMQGIANWAAISGANANEASRAMYNLAQALATGTVKLIDWKSIENANMATTEFKQTVIDLAVEQGALAKTAEGVYKTIAKGTEVSVSNFNEALSEGWFTNDVLMGALNRYGDATNKLNEIYEKLEGEFTTSSIVKYIDNYISALNSAREESKNLGLDAEETTKKVSDAGRVIAEEVAEDWGVTLEEATEMLSQFDNETAQFGLKAFKAAQEAKTFTDAINSVKDAVSTGWMKSFETIFGDYTHAKEFWTNIANTLYDIFAASGDARNEMLKDWSEQGGRDYFIDTIYAGLAAILSILSPIKAAWQAVFGKMTSTQLLALTKKIHSFVLSLVQTDSQMQKILRVFRGLFSVLDIGKTLLTQIIKGGFSVFQKIMKELNIDVGEFAASMGDGLYELRNWVKQQDIITNLFDKLGDAIVWVIQQVKKFISAVKEFGPVKAIIEGFHKTFGENFQGIGGIIQALGGIVLWLWSCFQNFKLPTSFADITTFFDDFAKTIRTNFEEIGVSFDWLDEAFAKLQNGTESTLGSVNTNVEKTKGVIGSAVSYVGDLFKDVDWSGVILAAFGTVTLATLWKFTDALKDFAGAFKNVTGVAGAAKTAFTEIGNYFKQLKKNIETNNLLKTAIAITALAVAFGLFSRLSWDEVKNGAIAMGTIAGVLLALSAAFTALNKFGFSAKNIGGIVISMAASVALLAAALNIVPSGEDVVARIGILVTILGALTVAMTAMSIFAKPLEISTSVFLGMAASIFLLIQTMKSIGEEDVASIYAALPVVSVLMAVMAAISRLMTYTKKQVSDISGVGKTTIKNGGAFANVIGIAIGLQLVISAIKRLGEMDVSTTIKGITFMVPVMLILSQLFKAASAAGRSAGEAGKMILFISAGLAILVPTVKKLASMDVGDLVKGGIAATLLTTAIMVPLVAVSKFAGANAAKAGLMILEIAGALAIIQLVIKTLGKVDLAALAKGVLAVSAVIVSFAAVIKAMNSGIAANLQSVDVMKKVLVIVGVLGALLLAMSLLNPDGALVASIGMSSVFLSLGAFFRLMNGIQLPDDKTLIKVIGSVTAIGVIIGILGAITDWQGALAVSAGMSLVIVALASMSRILKGGAISRTFTEKINSLIPFVGALAAVMAVLTGITGYATAKGGDVRQIVYVTTAMSELIVALGAMSKLMKGVKLPDETVFRSMAVLLAEVGGVVVILGGLVGLANRYQFDISGLLYLTTAMSELIVALGATMRLISGVKLDKGISDDLTVMTIFVTSMGIVLGAIVGIMNYIGADMSGIVIFASALSEVLIAFGISSAIMGKSNFNIGLAQAGAMSMLIAAIGATLGYFSTMTDPNTVLPLATGMSLVIIAIAAAARILATFPSGAFSGAIQGLGIALAVVSGMAVLLGVMGGINKLLPGLADMMADGATMMIQIGRGIGGFVGGIIGGFGEGIASGFPGICTNLSQGMVNLLPFFDALHQVPGGVLEVVGTLIAMVAAITGAQFISGLKAIPGLGLLLAAGSVTLVSDFAMFGKAIKSFSDELQGVDGENVKSAAEAVTELAKMEGSMAGLRAITKNLLGSDDLEAFGERLKALGEALSNFAVSTANVSEDSVSQATSVAEMLMALEQSLPPQNGILATFLGTTDIGAFGERLTLFGEKIAEFAGKVQNLDTDSIETARISAETLVALENSLSSTGFIEGFFFGSQDIGKFGDRITSFATALVTFSETVSGKIHINDFIYVASATRQLIDLESDMEVTGGAKSVFFGDKSLGSFGTNLISFGSALAGFSAQLNLVDFNLLQTAIEYIRDLVGLQDLDFTKKDTVDATKSIISSIGTTISNNERNLKKDGSDIMKWISEGFKEGTIAYQSIATNATKALANNIIATFQAALKIHSPSVVMNEMGQWVVQGLADGIDENDSAEEAAKKKAQNIVSAFESELSKLASIEKTADLEFELWQLTDGKNATASEINAKQLEIESNKLADLAKTVGMRKASMDAIEQMLGKESDEWQTAYQEYMQAQIDMYTKQQELDATYTDVVYDERDKMREYAEYIKDNTEAYEFLGKSQEDLEKAALKAVYGLNEEAIERKMAYDKLMSEYAESFSVFEDGGKALDEYAKQQTGWTGFETVKNTLIDTSQIISDNITAYEVNIEESVASATSEAIKSGTSSGSSASGAASTAGEGLGEIISNALADSTVSGMEENTQSVVDAGLELLNSGLPDWTDSSSMIGRLMGNTVDTMFGEGTAEKTGEVVDSLNNAIVGPCKDELQQVVAIANQYGKDFTRGFASGVSDSVMNKEVRAAITSIAEGAKSLSVQLDEHSPSRISMKFGSYFTEGFAIGVMRKANYVDDAVSNIASTASKSLSYASQAINSIIDSDDDFSPVITPVLDFDTLKAQANEIGGIIGTNRQIDFSASKIKVRNIAAQKSIPSSQNGSSTEGSQTNYNFTQNNYSPKALNRVEIYRQTNNQFSRLKGATKK